MTITNKKSNIDKRLNQRRSYSGHIFFVAKNGFNEGWLKDFSRSGLFIFTKARLSVGEIITVALPFLNGKKVKCKGQILRCTKEGFGIELFRNRSVVNLRIIK
jgi:Tfp pilus assembly protein PilZ